MASISPENWQHQSGQFLKVSLRCIYIRLAIYCHFQGKYIKSNKTTKSQRPLETAVNEARKVFQNQFPMIQIPSIKYILKFFAYFLFDFEWYERNSDNCQGVLRHIGDYVAGDVVTNSLHR